MMQCSVHTATTARSSFMKQGVMTGEKFTEMLKSPKDSKDTTAIFWGELKDSQRRKGNVLSKSALALDADNADQALPFLVSMVLGEFEYYLHSTYSHSAEQSRYRVIIPLAESVSPEQYTFMVEVLATMLGRDQFDMTCSEPSRLFYAPATQDRELYEYEVNTGALFDFDTAEMMNFVFDPAEAVELAEPVAPEEEKEYPHASDIEGTVGDFNRAYEDDLDAVIEAYNLPYEPSEDPLKWKLVGSHSAPGLHALDQGYFYSHHATDPAHGMRLTAFDLVSVHNFQGDEVKAKKCVNSDPRLVQAAVEKAKTEAQSAFTAIDAPVSGAEVSGVESEDVSPSEGFDYGAVISRMTGWNKRTSSFKATPANLEVLSNCDPTLQSIAYDELLQDVSFTAKTPWGEPAGTYIERPQISALYLHLTRHYPIDLSRSMVEVLVDGRSTVNRFNPVRDYLDSLQWDGVERLSSALPGVVENEYTAMVARKCLAAAVARVYEPGIKWDHIMVIQGTQGLGKTYWIEKMSRGFSSQLGNVSSADTVRTLHQSWISVSDECSAFSKGGFAEWKDFITRTSDDYRLPYDKRSHSRKRAQVIWATTNDEDFIPESEQGTRRFLVVKATEKVDFSKMTDEYIDQVWAEAKHLYLSGEKLYLTDEENQLAEAVREQFTGHDGLVGTIEAFISSPIAPKWDVMSTQQRLQWLSMHAEGLVESDTRRSEVSPMQVWVEGFGKNPADARNNEIQKLERIMRTMPSLSLISTSYQQPAYGKQPVYKILSYPSDAQNFEETKQAKDSPFGIL